MNSLSNFLERFKTLLTTSKGSKELIKNIIVSEAHINLTDKDFDVREGVIYTRVSSGARNTIFMRKKKILEALRKELGDTAPKDIR